MRKIFFVLALTLVGRAHAALNSVESSRLLAATEVQSSEDLHVSTTSVVALFTELERDYRAHDLPTFFPEQAAQNFLLIPGCSRTDDSLEGGIRHPLYTARCLSEAIARAR